MSCQAGSSRGIKLLRHEAGAISCIELQSPLSQLPQFPKNGGMSFEDRDYYRDRPRLEFSGGVGSGTMALLVLVIAGYVIGAMLANTISVLDPEWLSRAMLDDGEGKSAGARLFYGVIGLTDRNVAPWVGGFEAQPWKVLTSWLVEPSLMQMVMSAIGAYFVGRMYDELVGARRLLAIVAGLSILSALGASLLDPLLLGQRTSIIMGMNAALLGLIAPLIWLFPAEQRILSFPARRFIVVVLGLLLAFGLFSSISGSHSLVASPTQPLFAVAIAAGGTALLNRRGRLIGLQGAGQEDDRASWGKPMYRPDEDQPAPKRGLGKLFSLQRARVEVEDTPDEAEGERKRVDALLDKISKTGLDSLTKSERKTLDEHSRRMKK